MVLPPSGGSPHEGAGALRVKFYGVRGSTPCSCESNQRIGGNTACVVVTGDGFDPTAEIISEHQPTSSGN